MLNGTTSLWLGLVFVVVGAGNVWLILQATAQVREAKASQRLIAAHRIGGYVFVALFCVMAYYMVSRLREAASGSASMMIHMTLAMVLSPLIFVKVIIARYYKNYSSVLMPIGLTIFVLSFVLVGIIGGPAIASRGPTQTVSLATLDLPPAAIDLTSAAAIMEKRCSKCHSLERVTGARKDAQGWLATVSRMSELPDAGVSEQDVRVIVPYLVSQMAVREQDADARLTVARALVDQRCSRCHNLDRIYKTVQTADEWKATVDKMVAFAADSNGAFQPGEAQRILQYLSATQTPEGAARRSPRSGAREDLSAGNALPAHPAAATPAFDRKTLAFISIVCLGAVALIVRRPTRRPIARPAVRLATPPPPPLTAAVSASAGPLILRLASIAPQTRDSKTLRFVIADGRRLDARPGQFLTFSFLFDGKKISRSYSICSSAARSGYAEITVKRVDRGCASVYLNDRASVGMTVEAHGPFGHFCFDEAKQGHIVLVAAGSGITPMMAMLRYIDDLCLDTDVTLLYCVRTSGDVIFGRELDQLPTRLKHFRYELLLSQAEPEWTGARGHINAEFIRAAVPDFAVPEFFLCGPPPFMDTSRRMLLELGVNPERIRQESFGASKGRPPALPSTEPGISIEFARSQRKVIARGGRSLLEVAEEHGVTIPSFCRQGQCGTCRTRVLEGHIRMDVEQGLDEESRAQGFVLTCVGHADADVTLDA
jgi:ferredoxin-NADP reductase/mono/diheme cytochrome c family protein